MSKIFNVRLPNASQQYSAEQFNQLVRSLEQIVLQLNSTYGSVFDQNLDQGFSFYEGGGSNALFSAGQSINVPYGSFYDTTTQTAGAINTAYGITFNTTSLTNGVYVGTTTSRIYVDVAGIYNFEFSCQLDKASGATGIIWIWARVNGTNVVDSATKIAIQGTAAETVAAWNFLLDMNAGDYFELMWSTDDTSVQILAEAAGTPYPAIPSAILTVTYESALR